jgi:hypothetical protein
MPYIFLGHSLQRFLQSLYGGPSRDVDMWFRMLA